MSDNHPAATRETPGPNAKPGGEDSTTVQAPEDCILIKASAIHGLGAFARCNLPRLTRIMEYQGELVDKQESLRRQEAGNPFLFCLDDQHDLDGNVASNIARFFNHSCAPNCDAERIGGKIWITARRDIPAGEELTFNYGYDLDNYRDYPCHCQAENCRTYMVAEEFFSQIPPGVEPRKTLD
jgi:uncharacterized protein